MEKPAQEDESMEVALRRRRPRHDRQPATTKSTSSANVTDTDVHDTVDSSTEFNQEKNGKQEISIFVNKGMYTALLLSAGKVHYILMKMIHMHGLCVIEMICLLHVLRVSDTESIDGINGNVHSKTERSFSEVSSLPLSRMSSEKLIIPTKELYLERVYKKDVAHEFYCPNCNSCIQKVIIRGNEPAPNLEQFKCSSCFSFLIPIDPYAIFFAIIWPLFDIIFLKQWLWRLMMLYSSQSMTNAPILPFLFHPTGNWLFRDSVSKGEDKEKDRKSRKMRGISSSYLYFFMLRGSKKLEIVKSIVYGGLIESITSLTFVTSAASADAATSSIIALSLANLIGGIFTIAHNLSDLKSEQPREASSLANEQVDRYQELLGRRENFLIHATIALLSFLVFGLVPPAVYGFTFMETVSFQQTGDKNLMLAAVVVASLLCITILAIGKAYIQKPPKNHFKIVLSYLVTGLMASGVSYVAGDLAKKLIEKLGWFEPGKAVPLSLAEMSSRWLAWASY
ncbi:membrane protein of ER body [Salix suchowensis]|nr:membrane protein of ER body [Salix suchowensis]